MTVGSTPLNAESLARDGRLTTGIRIISADDRLQEPAGIKGQIWGRYGVGKTSLLWTLDPKFTLAIDLEAGMLAVQGWLGDSVHIRTWDEARDLACWIGGPNPALRSDQPYSLAHFDHVSKELGDPKTLEKYQTVFVDSTTNAARYCLQWGKGQPEAFSDRTGKPDMRGAYGVLGREMTAWATQWQYAAGKNIWLVGGLEEKTDDFNRRFWCPLLDGTKAQNELPYIFDEVISMVEAQAEDGST